MWVVVEFTDESLVEVIPNLWVIEHNLVRWPGLVKPELLKRMILKCTQPEESWEKCCVRILSKGKIYDDFVTATNAAKKAEYTSDLNSDDGKRIKFPSCRVQSSDENDDSDISDDYVKGLPSCPISKKKTGTVIRKNAHQRKQNSDSEVDYENRVTGDPTSSKANIKKVALNGNDQSNIKNDLDMNLFTLGENSSYDKVSATDNTKHLLKALVTQFTQLNKKMDIVLGDVTTLLNQAGSNNHEEKILFDQHFPINTINELNQFEVKLSDKVFYDNMVKFIQRIGGVDVNQFIKRAISRILNNEVQSQFNWLGKKAEKKAFKDLIFCKALSDAIARNNSTKDATEVTIENAIKNFLRHAGDRLKVEKKKNENMENADQR